MADQSSPSWQNTADTAPDTQKGTGGKSILFQVVVYTLAVVATFVVTGLVVSTALGVFN